jgi:hypothetical protein
VLRAIQDLVAYGSEYVTPPQQAALLEAAATIADVRTEEGVVDPLGRPATRLTFVIHYEMDEGSDVQWYVEPTTGQFMGEVWVDRATGQATSASFVAAAGISESRDEVPRTNNLYVPEGVEPPSF